MSESGSEAGAVGAPARVLLGLGANLDDPWVRLQEGVSRLRRAFPDLRVSGVYRSEPVGRGDQPDFLNLVAQLRTSLPPHAVLKLALGVERAMGRVRGERNGPRRIDIDLLAHDGCVLRRRRLQLPHPRMAERAFVLRPLAELAPDWRHPLLGLTAQEILSARGAWERVERVGDLDG